MIALQDALDIKTRSGSCHQGALNLRTIELDRLGRYDCCHNSLRVTEQNAILPFRKQKQPS